MKAYFLKGMKKEAMDCYREAVGENSSIRKSAMQSRYCVLKRYTMRWVKKGLNPDEVTYVLLMDACFSENQADDANGYFGKMLKSGLRT
ncbi:hypothetical protein MKX03_037861 [Papaver bracteatum]|nr:hypothetical protein MKX03_037861 [Papaver bracteatum]